MNQKKTLMLAVVTALVLAAGVFLSLHREGSRSGIGGTEIFADLEKSLAQVAEISLSKGDGSRTTLRKTENGWSVVERGFPADGTRVRELALGLANLRVIERKTSDPANYPRLGVEPTDTPTATGTLVEIRAGDKTWSVIVGKNADNRAVYVRKPDEAESLLASPFLSVDPDQKRWIDRLVVDVPGDHVHEISVQRGKEPAYLLRRAERGAELALTPVPKGREPASAMSLASQADALVRFNFDDVRGLPDPAPGFPDTATYRLFDGQVLEFRGRRDGEKSFISVSARRDPALAARFAAPPESATEKVAKGESPVANPAADAAPAGSAPVDQWVERLDARARGVEFEIPLYKYEAIFKPLEDLLEPKD
jgi:hypothetical protein